LELLGGHNRWVIGGPFVIRIAIGRVGKHDPAPLNSQQQFRVDLGGGGGRGDAPVFQHGGVDFPEYSGPYAIGEGAKYISST
jgi:hypothetical protein